MVKGSELGDLYQFSISDNRWTDLTQISSGSPPSPRTDHCSASSDVAFFVFGGLQSSFSLGGLWQYDVFKLEWRALHEISLTKQPPARCRCSLAYAADQLFLAGGYDYQGEDVAPERMVLLYLVRFSLHKAFIWGLSSEVSLTSQQILRWYLAIRPYFFELDWHHAILPPFSSTVRHSLVPQDELIFVWWLGSK